MQVTATLCVAFFFETIERRRRRRWGVGRSQWLVAFWETENEVSLFRWRKVASGSGAHKPIGGTRGGLLGNKDAVHHPQPPPTHPPAANLYSDLLAKIEQRRATFR